MQAFDPKNRITIQQLADELHLSVSTVSRALNDHPRISDETKRLVYVAAEKHGFFQKEVQKHIVQRLHHAIALLIPGSADFHIRKLIEGIRTSCTAHRLNLIIVETYKDFFQWEDALHYCYSLPVTGCIVYIDGVHTTGLMEMQTNHLPTVLIGNVDIHYPYQKIVIDHFMDSYLAVKHLVNSGWKRIAFLATTETNYMSVQHLAGFQTALSDFSIVDTSFFLQSSLQSSDVDACIQHINRLGSSPEAYMVERASAAMLLTRRLISYGVQVPLDVKVVSLEDDEVLALVHPSITSVFSPSYEVGHSAADSLYTRIQDRDQLSKSSLIIKSPHLILRTSSI